MPGVVSHGSARIRATPPGMDALSAIHTVPSGPTATEVATGWAGIVAGSPHGLATSPGALGDDTLLSRTDEIRLDPARLSCGLWEFREAVARDDPEAAVARHAGPFLDGVFLDEAPV